MKSLSANRPHAIVMVGIPGSGKSFFAEKFAETFNAPYVEKAFYKHFSKDEKAADEIIKQVLKQLAKLKQPIVLELDTSTKTERTDLAKELIATGYAPLFIWVQVDHLTAATRSKKAYGMPKHEHADHVKRFIAPDDTENAIVISGKHTYVTQARIVLKRLSGGVQDIELKIRKPKADRTSKSIVLR